MTHDSDIRAIEADSKIFIHKLDWIIDLLENSGSGFRYHTLFQHSNNKLKIEIDNNCEEERKLIYVFYHRQQKVFTSMERELSLEELKLLLRLVKESFAEEELVRNAHIALYSELYYFMRPSIDQTH